MSTSSLNSLKNDLKRYAGSDQEIEFEQIMATATANNTTNDKKEALINLSATIKLAQEMGQFEKFDTLNEAIILHYRKQEGDLNLQFKTFLQWKEEGFKIIKGSKAFYVWSSKKTATKETEEGEKKEFKFFGTCCLFSSNQVEKI